MLFHVLSLMCVMVCSNSKPLSEYLLWKLGRFRFARFTEHDHEKNTKGEGLHDMTSGDGDDISTAGLDLTQPVEHATSSNRRAREAAAAEADDDVASPAGAVHSKGRQHSGHETLHNDDDDDSDGHHLRQDVDSFVDQSGATNTTDL
jgi:hypothetical protein